MVTLFNICERTLALAFKTNTKEQDICYKSARKIAATSGFHKPEVNISKKKKSCNICIPQHTIHTGLHYFFLSPFICTL